MSLVEAKIANMKQDIAISVIIPMYNVEFSIDRCLSSLLVQNMPDVEYLFIDDYSTDGTVVKLTSWIAEHTMEGIEYKLIRHEYNQGVAAVRNTGLVNARGKYIYFVDADDYIEPNTLHLLYSLAEEQQADIVGCEWYLSFEKRERYMSQCNVQTGEELFQKMARGVMRWNLWLFLVKRSLYQNHHIGFIPKMNMGEDMMVMAKLALSADKVVICHHAMYHYVQYNSHSLTKNYHEGFSQVIANLEEIESFLMQNNRQDLMEYLFFMQLNVKLPFLISSDVNDYRTWLNTFPESNKYVEKNQDVAWYTRFIQKAAVRKQFWLIKLYYWAVIKLIYGIIFK